MADTIYMNRELSWLKFTERVLEDPDIRMQIQEMFVTMLSDNRKARIMNNKGNYKIEPSDNAPLNSQEVFLQQAYDNAAPAATDK